MKKFLAIILTICALASVFCVTAFAATAPAAGVVLSVIAERRGEEPKVIGDYDNFQDGWNDAMEIAGDKDEMRANNYTRIVVDLYADWNADKDGEFTDEIWNGAGFDNDTIYIPADAKVMINMNGHTINRGLTKDEDDGEVMFINNDADVIINDGTIKGGYSNSEGGGLYIEGGAYATLNNVNIVGNAVEGDDGAAVYLYDGATLTMNGGSISNNVLDSQHIVVDVIAPFGTLCAKDSTVILNDVTIEDNYAHSFFARGSVIYAERSTVKMSNCTVSGNATKESVTEEIIYAKDSGLTITNTDFINNNTLEVPENVAGVIPRLFYLQNSDLTMTGGKITGNCGDELFYFYGSEADMNGVTITDNVAAVMKTQNAAEVINMTECTLDNNKPKDNKAAIKLMKQGELVMTGCVLGNTTFSNMKYVNIVTPSVSKEEALIGISGILEDGTTAFTEYYKNIAHGWSLAMEHASSGEYDRVVVDLYADWTSYENGRFADSMLNGKGFYDYTIQIPEKARVTINLNGHTINRILAEAKENGEVILIDRKADVIINNGTISGGFSSNSAGGIHINSRANVTLNDVCISDNETSKTGNGAGIALFDYASVTMNGGSLTENRVQTYGTLFATGGAWANLTNVTVNNNRSVSEWSEGVAFAATNSGAIVLNDCVVSGNQVDTNSVVYGWLSTLIFNNTDFTDNASDNINRSDNSTRLFYCSEAGFTMKGGSVTNNHTGVVFCFKNARAGIEGVTITDNTARTITVHNQFVDKTVTLRECTLNNNKSASNLTDSEVMVAGTLSLIDCDLGDDVFEDNTVTVGAASMLGAGSLTMIISLLALVVSIACVGVTLSLKKKLVPSAEDNE